MSKIDLSLLAPLTALFVLELFCIPYNCAGKHVISMTQDAPSKTSCPCKKPELCLPIKDTTRKEVYAFSLTNDLSRWLMYDWSKLTTVVAVGYLNTTLMCLAHSHNVRVSYIPKTNVKFTDPSSRQSWVKEQVQIVETYYMDGINFDFEGPIFPFDLPARNGFTDLVKETKSALTQKSPYFQVTVDVQWKENIYMHYFDFKGLANHSDFLFVMAYDEQTQIFGECVAGPNAGFHRTFEGIENYLSKGIGPEKLVLGLPWYGYIFPCIKVEQDKCFMKRVPFQAASCSDHAGKEYNYAYIYALMKSHGGSGKWNSSSLTPFFTYQDSNQVYHQIQYDDPKSLSLKSNQANKYNLRGVGMWFIDALDYSDTPDGRSMREAMFGALPQYKEII